MVSIIVQPHGRMTREAGGRRRLGERADAEGDQTGHEEDPGSRGLGSGFSAMASVGHSPKRPLQPTCHPIR
jgi:hypothetical protein